MKFLKQSSVYIICFLLVMSIYQDLKGKSLHLSPEAEESLNARTHVYYEVVPYKVSSGETVISIAEKLYGENFKNIKIDIFIKDFMELNPKKKHYQLTPQELYLFPKYKFIRH